MNIQADDYFRNVQIGLMNLNLISAGMLHNMCDAFHMRMFPNEPPIFRNIHYRFATGPKARSGRRLKKAK